jgi:hemerythrin superfamily protein
MRKRKTDIFTLLKADHAQVEMTLKSALKENGKAKMLFTSAVADLDRHASFEETKFYPRLRKDRRLIPLMMESYEEHELMRGIIGDLRQMDHTDERWHPKLKVLLDLIEHHAKEEESAFPEAKKLIPAETNQELVREFRKEMAG